MIKDPTFTLGVEEEYLLVDKETRDLANDPPAEMLERCKQLVGEQVSPEFMRSQIEVGTTVCADIKAARKDLCRLRRAIVDVAGEYGLAPIAASSHPFAHWFEQKHTERPRYSALARDMQQVARRLLICGMHVHVGIEDDEVRIDLMNQFAYFLPHLLAMSCSSPFWNGENTGLKSYRLTVFDGMHRNRLPEYFDSYADYQQQINVMVKTGIIEDATKVWWDIRPSARYPTLEMRITDICPRIEDAICLTALTQCTMRMLYRLRRANQRWRVYSRMLVGENRWRAMRYSFDEGLVDLGKREMVPYPHLLDELLYNIREDADALDCVNEVERARQILRDGTSAHRQIATFEKSMKDGATTRDALCAVVDQLVEETASDLDNAG